MLFLIPLALIIAAVIAMTSGNKLETTYYQRRKLIRARDLRSRFAAINYYRAAHLKQRLRATEK